MPPYTPAAPPRYTSTVNRNDPDDPNNLRPGTKLHSTSRRVQFKLPSESDEDIGGQFRPEKATLVSKMPKEIAGNYSIQPLEVGYPAFLSGFKPSKSPPEATRLSRDIPNTNRASETRGLDGGHTGTAHRPPSGRGTFAYVSDGSSS